MTIHVEKPDQLWLMMKSQSCSSYLLAPADPRKYYSTWDWRKMSNSLGWPVRPSLTQRCNNTLTVSLYRLFSYNLVQLSTRKTPSKSRCRVRARYASCQTSCILARYWSVWSHQIWIEPRHQNYCLWWSSWHILSIDHGISMRGLELIRGQWRSIWALGCYQGDCQRWGLRIDRSCVE